MANPILVRAQQQVTESRKRTEDSIRSLEATMAGVDNATKAIVENIDTLASSAVIKNTQEQVAEAKAQKANINVQQAAGGFENQVRLLTELEEENQRVEDAADRVLDVADDQITGIGIIDGVINSFRNVSNQIELEAATAARNATAGRITSITQASEQFARANALTKETVTQATIEAGNKAIVAEASIDAYRAQLDGMQANASMVGMIMQADGRALTSFLQEYRLQQDEQADELRDLQIKQLKKQIADKEVSDADIVKYVQAGQAAYGLAPQNPETIIAAFNETGTLGERTKQLFIIGASSAEDGNVKYGATPYQAATTLSVFDPNGNVDNKYTDTLDRVNTIIQERVANNEMVAPKNDSEYELAFNTIAAEIARNYEQEIVSGDNSNPYHAPPMESVTMQKNVQQTAFYRKVPAIGGMTEFDPARIKEAGIEAIVAGTLTQEEYIDGMVAFTQSAMALNNTMEGGLLRYGLPIQSQYISRATYKTTPFSISAERSGLPAPVRTENKLVDYSSVEEVTLDLVKSLAGLPKGTVPENAE